MGLTGFASPSGDKAFFFDGGSCVRHDVTAGRSDDGTARSCDLSDRRS
jgi:hypothetical protein